MLQWVWCRQPPPSPLLIRTGEKRSQNDIPDGKYLIWATAGSGLDSLGTRVVGSDFSDAPFTISTTPGNAADASSGGGSSFAALLFSIERQLEELERLLNSLLAP